MAIAKLEAGVVKCLGWCGKTFLSKDKIGLRFCPKCSAKKDQTQRTISLKVYASGGGE